MKKIYALTILAAVAFSSCKKDEHITPKSITYSVQCMNCMVYINGAVPLPLKKENQLDPVNVKGSWTFKIDNPTEKSFSLDVHAGFMQESEKIKASIESDTNKSVSFDETIGINNGLPSKLITLNL